MLYCVNVLRAVFLLVLGFSAVASAFAEESPPPQVVISRARAQDLYNVLTYPARVNPKINTTLLAESDGVVTSILAPLGQSIKKGQTVLTITHTDPVYQYAPVQVVSPVSGAVSSLDVTTGAQVIRGQKVGSVTDPHRLRLNVEIPAQDLQFVQAGLEGEFTSSEKDGAIPVKIKGFSPTVDPSTGTASGEIEILKKDIFLAPGMVGQVTFKTQKRKGLLVPDYAVNYRGTDPFLNLLENGKIKRVAVKMGPRQRGFIEILTGVPEQSIVVERASRFVGEGEKVLVQNPDAMKDTAAEPASKDSGA